MHLAPLIRDLAVILGVAGIVTAIFHRIKQPVVLGYIIAGFIVGPHTLPFPLVSDIPSIKTWAELGVIFLMFSLGLEFSFRRLASVGVSAGITVFIEMSAMFFIGLGLGHAFHWQLSDCVFLGAMLSISSTTIILKALTELGLKSRKFAQMIFGVLIVEDLAAILMLVVLSAIFTGSDFSVTALMISAGKLLLIVGSWFISGYFIVPKLIKKIGKSGSDEMLIVIALGLCLFLVVVASRFGYSVALGSFIMGSILSESTESHRIEQMVKPLRDIFAAVFFVSVGMLLDPASIVTYKFEILIVSAALVLGKIFYVTLGSLISGQPLKTSVRVGFGLAQIGEFSFIIATLGMASGVISDFLYPLIVAVSLITTFTTPFCIKVSGKVSEKIEHWLPRKIILMLDKYVAWNEVRRQSFASSKEATGILIRWILNAIIVTAVWLAFASYAQPFIRSQIENDILSRLAGWIASLVISAPFIWAMLTSGIVMQVLTLILLGVLSLNFISVVYVGAVIALISILLFKRFYSNLEKSYRWFEEQFLTTFSESRARSRQITDELKNLAPWDGHLVSLTVHPDAEISGKRIQDVMLRKLYGLNVVAIQRGSKAFVSPHPDFQIFPHDELLVLGTDDQVESARSMIEKAHGKTHSMIDISDYALKRFFILENSPLLGKTIRESKIREQFGAMVVGVERKGHRMMNPDTDLTLELDDGILVVGSTEKIENLIKI